MREQTLRLVMLLSILLIIDVVIGGGNSGNGGGRGDSGNNEGGNGNGGDNGNGDNGDNGGGDIDPTAGPCPDCLNAPFYTCYEQNKYTYAGYRDPEFENNPNYPQYSQGDVCNHPDPTANETRNICRFQVHLRDCDNPEAQYQQYQGEDCSNTWSWGCSHDSLCPDGWEDSDDGCVEDQNMIVCCCRGDLCNGEQYLQHSIQGFTVSTMACEVEDGKCVESGPGSFQSNRRNNAMAQDEEGTDNDGLQTALNEGESVDMVGLVALVTGVGIIGVVLGACIVGGIWYCKSKRDRKGYVKQVALNEGDVEEEEEEDVEDEEAQIIETR